MLKDLQLVLIGVISSAHGVKGHIVLKSYTSPANNIFKLNLVNSQNIDFPIKKIRTISKNLVIGSHIHCINRNQAELLVGTKLYCSKHNLPNITKEEFYFEELKGLQVLNSDKEKIGIISGIFNFGAGDLIEIRFLDNTKEIYPFTHKIFPKINKDHAILVKRNYLPN